MDEAAGDDNVKLKCLETLESGKLKVAFLVLGYNGMLCQAAWQTLARDFGRPELRIGGKTSIEGNAILSPNQIPGSLRNHQVFAHCFGI